MRLHGAIATRIFSQLKSQIFTAISEILTRYSPKSKQQITVN
ncbi:hypothetical protein Cylst_4002 [Cylindrospermum stagnale PCC 7417]|uniref:Uncharacterized protein n=1 Tax=Cylindrospermum stagnale PCC 7417 TaxID=56107 RepID=K9X353_9NOST|nr:hypothetical protein Cylst_4002 [Cylindrospermum stagnale PCC 7417]